MRFALVGCGRIAEKHALLCERFGTLSAVCDIVPEKADLLGKRFGAKVYHQLEEMLEKEKELTVLVICTPNGFHAEQTILGLENELHVICEKPMALTVSDAQRMVDVSSKTKRQLFIVKQNRYNDAVVAARKLFDDNAIGKIYSIQLNAFWNRNESYYRHSWHGDKKLDGGILFTQFSHFIDLMYWLAGSVTQVRAYARSFHPEYEKNIEDSLVTCFEMENGAIGTGHFTINAYEKNMEGSLTLFGEKGTLKIGGRYLNEISYQCTAAPKLSIREQAKENDYGSYQGSMSNHDKVYEHVAEVLSGKAINRFSGEQGIETIKIIEKIYASLV